MINEEFYRDIVCQCPQPTHVTPVSNATFKAEHEMMYLYKCSKCGLLERGRLYKCGACQSAFYRYFMHPKQSWRGPFCWHCLENNRSFGKPNWWESQFPAIPPPAYLIQPEILPQSMGDTLNELNALLESLG